MTNTEIKSQGPVGTLIRYAWNIYLLFFCGLLIGVLAAGMSAGSDVLGLPKWGWFYCVGAWTIAVAATGALPKDSRSEIAPVYKLAALFAFVAAGATWLVGSIAPGPAEVSGVQVGLHKATTGMSTITAWLGLAVAPSVALIASGLALRKSRGK